MKFRAWWKRAALSLGLVVVIATIAELARPGTMLCPLRRAGAAIGIPMEYEMPDNLDHFSKEDREQANKEAAKWKAAALAKFPNLRIESHPLPPEANGYWQLCLLEKNPLKPTAELSEILNKWQWEKLDEEKARTALAANEEWMRHVESIAALPGRSSVDLPGGHVFLFPISPMRQAMNTLLIQSVLAARSKDQHGALRAMKAAGNIIDHLHKVETPTFLTETACILCHLLRLETIFQHILPAIGPSADLDAWEEEMQRMKISPSHLSIVLRGEWHVGCDTMIYPMLPLLHSQRRMIDPEAVAMAYAEIVSEEIDMLRTTKLKDIPHATSDHTVYEGLSHEGRGLMDDLHFGTRSWDKGYLHHASLAACHQAAMDLLQIEPCQGDLGAEDAERITLDPLTGKPFDFDPFTRTLRLPGEGSVTDADVEVKLPWKAGF